MKGQLDIPHLKQQFASPTLTPSNQYKQDAPGVVVAPNQKRNEQNPKTLISKKILTQATKNANNKKGKYQTQKPPLKKVTNGKLKDHPLISTLKSKKKSTLDYEPQLQQSLPQHRRSMVAAVAAPSIAPAKKHKRNKSEGRTMNVTTILKTMRSSNRREESSYERVQTYKKPKSNKDGLSISSFSSQSGRHKNDSIAKQLSKNYFLNPCQLLKHLSPQRMESRQPNNTVLETGQRNARGRNRSTVNATGLIQKGQNSNRKTHSHSNSRKNQTLKPAVLQVSQHEIESALQPQIKQQAPVQKSKSNGSQVLAQNKKAVDKLIKQNIKKNKNKHAEEVIKKQLEELKQKQRKADLTQRNNQVRQINASKVKGNVSQRRISQSVLGQQPIQSPSTERKKQSPIVKIIPNTTMAAQQKGCKPRSFALDEIKQLTQLVEKELGVQKPAVSKTRPVFLGVTNEDLQIPKPRRKSVEIHKFIEKKKREQVIRKSLERTIEVDKQIKIQKNLNSLNKFVKKQTVKGKKMSVSSRVAKKKQSIQMGISQIFNPQYRQPLELSITASHEDPLGSFVNKEMSQTILPAKTAKNKGSIKKSGKGRKVLGLINQMSAGTRSATGAVISGGSRIKQNAHSSSMNAGHIRKITLQPENQKIIPPSNSQILHKESVQSQQIVRNKASYNTTAVAHNISQNQSLATPSIYTNPEQMKYSPSRSTGNIRRVHELVALYRFRFKPKVSDASIMGTLHAAASVIQIHYRYMRQLRLAKAQAQAESFINSEDEEKQVAITPAYQQWEEQPPQKILFEETKGEKQVIKSVLPTSEADPGTSVLHSRVVSIGEQQKLITKASPPKKQPQKMRKKSAPPKLNIELIESDNKGSQNEKAQVKTPQVPGLDLKKVIDFGGALNLKKEENKAPSKEQVKDSESLQTVSSYRGIFSRIGVPLPRSARVRVDYDLIKANPQIEEHLREVIEKKRVKGKEVLYEAKRDNLISERTLNNNILKLEKWVDASYLKIEAQPRSAKKPRIQKPDELIQQTFDDKKRLDKIMEAQSARSSNIISARKSARAKSWRAQQQTLGPTAKNEEAFTDRDPYNQQRNQVKERTSLVDMINGDSSRTSKRQKYQSGSSRKNPAGDTSSIRESARLEEITIQIDSGKDKQHLNSSSEDPNLLGLKEVDDDSGAKEGRTETQKSLNRSQSYPFQGSQHFDSCSGSGGIVAGAVEKLNEDSEEEDGRRISPEQIEFQLEDALDQQKKRLEDIRDPSFFSNNIDKLEILTQDLIHIQQQDDEEKPKEQTNTTAFTSQKPDSSGVLENSLIKVENQLTQDKDRPYISTESSPEVQAVQVPVSPTSDFPIFTGAHSLSSTDSDIQKAIQMANQEILETPPELSSPTNQQKSHEELANMITDQIFVKLLHDLDAEIDIMVPRPAELQPGQTIKFYEKKGIRTDLFAIERYVDEIQEDIKDCRKEFMDEIVKAQAKNPLDQLFEMQNSEIGTHQHFQNNMPPVLSLDMYLKLEKRRKESRDVKDPTMPNGLFDFENVDIEELKQQGLDLNFLAECQHIHNKVLFDCINDSLQQFRPHGKDGVPMDWSRGGRKLKPTEDFTLEEMLEITKHDLFRQAIMQAGTLPRREFVFGGHFDEELFAEIREKKLATLLCREIVESEPTWLKWDYEEAQTKIDLGDMILEHLVTETVQFLNDKNKSASQQQFEKIEKMILEK